MTKEEILEGNRLIAEFLGYIYVPYTAGNSGGNHGWVLKNYKLIDKKMPKLFLGRTTKDLLYHKSWDWLMPIVEKISTINHGSKEGQRYIFNTNRCAKFHINENDKPIKIRIKGVMITYPMPFIEINSFDELEGTWLAVVEFIKWYNEKCSK